MLITQELLERALLADQEIRPSIFEARSRRAEIYASAGQIDHGLLEIDGERSTLPRLGPDGVLRMERILARGSKWRLLIISDTIESLDTQGLQEGELNVFAALSSETVACGELIREYPDGETEPPIEYQASCRPRVLLVVGEERFRYRDFIAVAKIRRHKEGHRTWTEIDPTFHPRITSLEAYTHTNPVPQLADALQQALAESAGKDVSNPLEQILQLRLETLRQCSRHSPPPIVFEQVMTCVKLARLLGVSLSSSRPLERHTYDPETFPEVLADIDAYVNNQKPRERFPKTMEIGSRIFVLLPNIPEEVDQLWCWNPGEAFRASNLLLYLRAAPPGRVPQVRYAFSKSGLNSPAWASALSGFDGVGEALELVAPDSKVEALFFNAETLEMREELRHLVTGGLRVYYR